MGDHRSVYRSRGNKDGHLGIYQSSADSMTMNDGTVQKIDGLWEKAKLAAATDEQLARVKRSELIWTYYKANARKGEFSLTNPGRFDEKEKLFNTLSEFGIHRTTEGNEEYDDYKDCISVRYCLPEEWHMFEAGESGAETINFFGRILEAITPILTGFGLLYKLVRALAPIGSAVSDTVC